MKFESGNIASRKCATRLIEFAQKPPFGACANQYRMGQNNIAKKVYPLTHFTNLHFVRMKFELEFFAEECPYLLCGGLEKLAVGMHDDKIVTVTKIVLCLQSVFNKLVKFIQIDICKKLACYISQWQSLSFCFFKTCEYRINKLKHVGTGDMLRDKRAQYNMIDRIKKFSHITLERICLDFPIFTYLATRIIQTHDSSVSTLVLT